MKSGLTLSRARRLVISLFLVVNFGVILYRNVPEEFAPAVADCLSQHVSAHVAQQFQLVDWRVRQYAYLTGLDNRWQMFGYQSRFNWWYVIRGVYGDGDDQKLVTLPLPNQSPRTTWQHCVTDIKEQKFQLNIYNNELAREAYSRYLARQLPSHEGKPIRAVKWELGYQMIMPPEVAVAEQKLVYPGCAYMPLNEFSVSSTDASLASQTP